MRETKNKEKKEKRSNSERRRQGTKTSTRKKRENNVRKENLSISTGEWDLSKAGEEYREINGKGRKRRERRRENSYFRCVCIACVNIRALEWRVSEFVEVSACSCVRG